MEHSEIERDDSHKRSKGVIPYIIIALLILIIVILLGVFFLSPESVTKFSRSAGNFLGQQQTAENTDGTLNSDQSGSSSIKLGDTQPSDLADGSAHTSGTSTGDLATNTKDGTNYFDSDSSKATGKDCKGQADNIESFFNSLDSRDYIKDFQLDAPSNKYFPKLIQKLVDNPPIVSGETDDLFTILQNTAHFFRIIHKKNILVLKGILDRERETCEQILADFYQLTKQPECLQKRFDLTIDQESLYAYAGFFINTMGGRLYLFRRNSMSRMVVSYYAILIIEQANREGRNKVGVDIKDSIENLIIEIESSRIELQMRDVYLETLYDLMVKYQ